MMTNFKVGDKYVIVNVNGLGGGEYHFHNGEIAEVGSVEYLHSYGTEIIRLKPKRTKTINSKGLAILPDEMRHLRKVEVTAKYKVGDKVQILDADAIEGGVRHFKTGDITTIANTTDKFGEQRVYVAPILPDATTDGLYLYESEMQYLRKMPKWVSVTDRSKPAAVVPIPQQYADGHGSPTPGKRTPVPSDAMTIIAEEMMAMRKILERIAEQGDGVGDKQSDVDGVIDSLNVAVETYKATSGAPKPTNVNAARAQAIEEAAEFVSYWTRLDGRGKRVTRLMGAKVDFLVFANERKVVVKIHYRHGLAVGVAQCHPDDTFNETLGLGIALARAIGEPDVARKLASAPQPDEMAVGSVVGDAPSHYVYKKTVERMRPQYSRDDRRFEFSDWERGFTYRVENYGMRWAYIHQNAHVYDDTRADYSLAAKKRGGL